MDSDSIKIGVLFSQTGKMAVTENAHMQGILLACEEINKNGGIDGSLLAPIVLNPDGDDRKYSEMATDLLLKHKVNSIFGCCLSSNRKAVLPIVERFNGILFYPSVYEGFEYSPNVIYGGAVPNQIIIPLLEYIYRHHGRRIALIGSETLYAREINRIVAEFLLESEGVLVSETYIPFGTSAAKMTNILNQKVGTEADAILSTVVGEDSVALYNAYGNSMLLNTKVPIASLTTTESELEKIVPNTRAGHLSIASYFGSLNTALNKKFVAAFKNRFGKDKIPSVYSADGYSLIHIYANAVKMSGTTDTDDILAALSNAKFKAPRGDIIIDIETNHFMLRPLIAKSRADGHFDIVWEATSNIQPDPYLVSYDRSINIQHAL